MLETILLIISVLLIVIVLLQGNKASDAGQIITGGNEALKRIYVYKTYKCWYNKYGDINGTQRKIKNPC